MQFRFCGRLDFRHCPCLCITLHLCCILIKYISKIIIIILVQGWDRGKPAAFDVTVTSPLTPVSLNNANASVGAAAYAAECRKHAANDARCQELGWLCIPLAVETYGNRPFRLRPWNVAGQSDVIIRSDVTSGVHPPNAPWYFVTNTQYTIVIFLM